MRDEARLPIPDLDTLERGWPPGFGRGRRELDALLVLTSLAWIRPLRLRALAWRRGSAAACLDAVRSGGVAGAADTRTARRGEPSEIRAALDRCGARVVLPGDPEYEPRLLALADPPPALFLRGRELAPLLPRVSIVGTRKPTRVGAEVAESIAADLAASGVCVVSGAANGIDSCAHSGAIVAGGPTVAVLAEGIVGDRGGPRGALLGRIADRGTIVSEAAPGVRAMRHRFPARNRIVAALGAALVVVEGAERSGSTISVDHALDLGRDVYAVPGSVTSPLAHVPLSLIREGATMIRGVDDLLDDLGYGERLRHEAPPSLAGDELAVYEALAGGTLPDAIARATDLSLATVTTVLLTLELKGLVRAVAGRYERRVESRRA